MGKNIPTTGLKERPVCEKFTLKIILDVTFLPSYAYNIPSHCSVFISNRGLTELATMKKI